MGKDAFQLQPKTSSVECLRWRSLRRSRVCSSGRIGSRIGRACPGQHLPSLACDALPSAAFGAYLAHFLAKGTSYFDSYTETMRAIAKHAQEVAEDLTALYGRDFELTRRLTNRDEDWTPIEIAGSAAFFE